jgi:hypothetical protein
MSVPDEQEKQQRHEKVSHTSLEQKGTKECHSIKKHVDSGGWTRA